MAGRRREVTPERFRRHLDARSGGRNVRVAGRRRPWRLVVVDHAVTSGLDVTYPRAMPIRLALALVLLASCGADPQVAPADAPSPDAAEAAPCGGACGAGTVCELGRCVAVIGLDAALDIGIDAALDAEAAAPTADSTVDRAEPEVSIASADVGADRPIVCAAGTADCDGDPSNGCEARTVSDPRNCGSCEYSCPGERSCVNGACVLVCQMGLTACGGACVDTRTNARHCGACGTGCNTWEACVGGTCVGERPDCAPRISCGGRCVDAQTDINNCGGCGTRCVAVANASVACMRGTCIQFCVIPYDDCDGNPVNGCETSTVSNGRHCGGCGIECAAPLGCQVDTCACPSNTISCGGACTNPRTDRANCGGCNVRCAGNEDCVAGACARVCGATETLCDGRCRDLLNDTSHCGECNRSCSGLRLCYDGVCRL